jgi:hypothetical protein
LSFQIAQRFLALEKLVIAAGEKGIDEQLASYTESG